ncbi:MAG: sedoheptulose 7-phosphate cyclase [Anaerolineales bacterium]|jgi:3-dehydroquinate synthase
MTNESKPWRVTYQRNIEYEVVNSPYLFDPQNTDLLYPGWAENSRRFVVIDSNVEGNYADKIRNYFFHHDVNAKIVSFPGGEVHKNIENYLTIARKLDTFPIHRRDEPIIAIGGGVLTDLVGFVASSYRRSVPHLKVPTTLMGYIDASIGIKTGINFNGQKNRLGAFEPPIRVLLDKAFLKTLPKRHILNGVSEIIKLAIIRDEGLFALLERHGAASVSANFQDEMGGVILDRAITGMLEELEPNLFEDDLARRVDFGHTFGYGLEVRNEAHLLHGEAVLLDIVVSTMIALERFLISEGDADRIFGLIEKLGIPLNPSYLDPYALWQSLEERTCHRNGLQRVPMPNGIGDCVFINDIQLDEIQSAYHGLVERLVIQHDGV